MNLTITAPGELSLRRIADAMDPMDAAELGAIGEDRLESLKDCVASSYECFVAHLDGNPWAVFGIAASGVDGEVGVPWLISTGFGQVPAGWRNRFLKLATQTIARWRARHSVLVNYVYTEHRVAHRWLSWMGFTVETNSPQTIGGQGEIPVYRFHWTRNHDV